MLEAVRRTEHREQYVKVLFIQQWEPWGSLMGNRFQVNVKNWLLSGPKKHQGSQKLFSIEGTTTTKTTAAAAATTTTTTTTSSSSSSSSSSSIGTTAHCGLWPAEQCPSIFSYQPPTLSIFSLPALEDLFLLPLSIFSWVFPFISSLPVLEWRSFRASYPPPFSLGNLWAYPCPFIHFTIFSPLLISSSSRFVRIFHSPFSYLGEQKAHIFPQSCARARVYVCVRACVCV